MSEATCLACAHYLRLTTRGQVVCDVMNGPVPPLPMRFCASAKPASGGDDRDDEIEDGEALV